MPMFRIRVKAAAFAAGFMFTPAIAAVEDTPLATPPGITLQTARVAAAGGAGARMGGPTAIPVYASAKGMTLYTFDKDTAGASSCVDACATAWPPYLADSAATASGDWSLITRDDRAKQWAYKGVALYTYAKDEKIGEAKGNGVDQVWRLARFQPAADLPVPPGIAVQEYNSAVGQALLDERGFPLYTFDEDAKGGKPTCVTTPCTHTWTPVRAPQLGMSIGPFSVVARGDGMFQWAFRGRPLYTFAGDFELGDATGDGFDKRFRVALVERYFTPPGVMRIINRFGGSQIVTSNGMALYVRNRSAGSRQGHSLRAGSQVNPAVGRLLGVSTCDAACTKTWKPLIAPAGATSSGYWDVVLREDSKTRQWAYRGFPVYTFTGDKKPGDMNGNDIYELMKSEDPFTAADIGILGAGAMVWHTVVP